MHDPIPFWRPVALASAIALLFMLGACDDGSTSRPDGVTSSATPVAGDERAKRPARGDALDAVRERADQAFAELESPRARGESRIGPQPWPEDLPARWPRFEDGRVLADTRREGNRLLLVDLSGDPAEALDRYDDALRAGGFEVAPGRGGGAGSLRVIDATTQAAAELTFYPRETVTRVEILFLERSSG